MCESGVEEGFYLSKSNNNAVKKDYTVKVMRSNFYLSKSTKILVSKCTGNSKSTG